jgi:hypothetical protein
MPQELEDQIRERAYQLWIADGCPEGEADRYWLAAERALLAGFAAAPVAPAAKPKKSRRAAVIDMIAKPAKVRRAS